MSKNILFALSGSIACYKAAALISKLVQAGYSVQAVATSSALKFIGEATLEGLTGKRVMTDTFAAGDTMQHIHLVKWADITVLAPASANSLNKLSAGLGDDLVSTLFVAHDFTKPYLVAPAMNTQMYFHPATQESMARLQDWGVQVIESPSGALACGDVGAGRMAEPETIFAAITKALADADAPAAVGAGLAVDPSFGRLKVLISSGGTSEAIDGVRAIRNTSTGRTGAAIADSFASHGHEITFATADGASRPKAPVLTKPYVSFNDLDQVMKSELEDESYDAVLHLAAVSDYAVDHLSVDGTDIAPNPGAKIASGADLTVHLKRNPKIVDRLRDYSSNPALTLIAFKLTKGLNDEQALAKVVELFESSQADFVVHNDLAEIALDGENHRARIFDRDGAVRADVATKADLARALENLIHEKRIES
jgi:phosphopantothenoylcysteine decarboxylase/phosphopantothenate--cysteine ligase